MYCTYGLGCNGALEIYDDDDDDDDDEAMSLLMTHAVCWTQAGNDSDSEFSGCTTCRDSGMDPSEDSDHVPPYVRQLT